MLTTLKKIFKPGLYKIDKPSGWTSFDVVNWMRQRSCDDAVKRVKVGHAGTLDPGATGLLIVSVGRKFTRNIDTLINSDKEYIFEITFGKVTDSYDMDGKVIRETKDFEISKEKLLPVLEKYRGKIKQVPPMFSAKQKDGQRLYQLARKGIEVEREAVEVEIKELELLEFSESLARLRVVCSKGMYVRSLCYDIGETLGCGAYMSSLVRTRIGDFNLKDSDVISLEKLKKEVQ